MVHGYAWHVRFPRRPGQDYTTTDTAHAATDVVLSAVTLGWAVTVELVNYRGPSALPVTTCVTDLLDHMPSPVRGRFKTYDDGRSTFISNR